MPRSLSWSRRRGAVSAPLGQAIAAAHHACLGRLVLDGTLVRTDRMAANCPFYSGKHHQYGMKVRALTFPRGTPQWISPALPGSVHDLTAALTRHTIDTCATAGILVPADKGYHGAGATVHTPYKGRELTGPYRDADWDHTMLHCFATRKIWPLLRKVRSAPHRIEPLTATITVLETHG